MASLVISLPDGIGETYELSGQRITVGRFPGNDIQIDDSSVSDHHAEFSLHGAAYQLTDLGSTNGTYVNAAPIEKAELAPGTHIRFGKIDAVYSPVTRQEIQPFSELEIFSEMSAIESRRSTDVSNTFQFKPKRRVLDKTGIAIIGFAIFSIIVFLGAVAAMLLIEVPQ